MRVKSKFKLELSSHNLTAYQARTMEEDDDDFYGGGGEEQAMDVEAEDAPVTKVEEDESGSEEESDSDDVHMAFPAIVRQEIC